MTKRQLTLQHQGKDVTPGKGISKLLCMKGAARLYGEPTQDSIVPPSVSKVGVRVFTPWKADMGTLRYSHSHLTTPKRITLPVKPATNITLPFSSGEEHSSWRSL